MNPRRIKGVGAFASAYGLYAYAPYLTIYLGTTFPMLGAVALGLYGMLAFSESKIINSISIIDDEESEHHGRLIVTVGESAFRTSEIVVDVRDICSIVALGNDDLGNDNVDGNVLRIKQHFSVS